MTDPDVCHLDYGISKAGSYIQIHMYHFMNLTTCVIPNWAQSV